MKACRTCGRKLTWRSGGVLCGSCSDAIRNRYRLTPKMQRAVHERCGWRCHVCHKLTLPGLLGTLEPLAPCVDHLLSISGGGHPRGPYNLATAHVHCNSRKGGR